MSYNRSRDSILYLFDPLARPATPSRNTSSPDLSDKENDSPQPGPVTEFFSRSYKTTECDQRLPPGRLIDFGDISMSDSAVDDTDKMDVVEEPAAGCEADDVQMDSGDVSDLITLSTPAKQRAPLAEIKLERTPPAGVHLPPTVDEDSEPSNPFDFARRSVNLTDSQREPTAIISAVSAAPYGTPLADVINSINLAAFLPAASTDVESAHTEPHGTDALDADVSLCPSITVSPPDEDVAPISHFADGFIPASESPLHLSPTALRCSVSGTRRIGVMTDVNDPRRASVDLHRSFSLHMQSAEMSFDLLNDKISLFGQPQDSSDSLWTGLADDDTLDFSRERRTLQDAADRFFNVDQLNTDDDTFDLTKEKGRIEAAAVEYGSIHEESLLIAEAAAAAAVLNSPRHPSAASTAPLPLIFTPPTKTSTPKDVAASSVSLAPVLPAPIFTPRLKEKEELKPKTFILARSGSSKPLPSLRIVRKCPKVDFEDLDAQLDSAKALSSSGSESRPSSRTGTHRSGSEGGEDPTSGVLATPRPTIKPCQPMKSVRRPGAIVQPLSTRPTPAKPLASLALRTGSLSRATAPPQRPSLGQSASSLGRAAASALQRAAASASSSRTATQAATERPSGMRAPLRFVAPSAPANGVQVPVRGASSSGLPKPTTKPPASSRTFGFPSKPSVFFKKPS